MREYLEPVGATPDTLSISYHLSRLLLHLLDCSQLPPERRDLHSSDDVRDVILEKINRYVRQHLGESVTISDLAEAAYARAPIAQLPASQFRVRGGSVFATDPGQDGIQDADRPRGHFPSATYLRVRPEAVQRSRG